MIHQGDFLDKDRFIALICDVEDIYQYTDNMRKARKLLNDETFRKRFIDNLMQDWELSMDSAIESIEDLD